MPLGQQDDYGYMDGYLKRKNSQSDAVPQTGNLSSLAEMSQDAVNQTGSSTDTKPFISKEFSQGASRGAGGGLGSALMSGGIASGNPYAAGAGVAVMALEGDAQAKQANEEAKAIEAQQRKQAQLAAINNLIGVSKGLSVM